MIIEATVFNFFDNIEIRGHTHKGNHIVAVYGSNFKLQFNDQEDINNLQELVRKVQKARNDLVEEGKEWAHLRNNR